MHSIALLAPKPKLVIAYRRRLDASPRAAALTPRRRTERCVTGITKGGRERPAV